MDRNGDGHLSYNELRAMLESDAFDCGYEDVEEAGATGCDLVTFPFNKHGSVSKRTSEMNVCIIKKE